MRGNTSVAEFAGGRSNVNGVPGGGGRVGWGANAKVRRWETAVPQEDGGLLHLEERSKEMVTWPAKRSLVGGGERG